VTAYARDASGGAVLEILAQPRASRSRVVGEHDGCLKIQLAAPPVDGEANAALLAFLADRLGLKRADVVLLAGETGRRKRVKVAGLGADAAARLLLAEVPAAGGSAPGPVPGAAPAKRAPRRS
jgi:uncharacterized protein (TIGR00251 family)